jgi:hypothetical protein
MDFFGHFVCCFEQQDVSEFSCTCERHIGTQSGGMDQVSFLHLIVFLQNSHSFEIFVSCGFYFLVVLSILASNCKGFQLKLGLNFLKINLKKKKKTFSGVLFICSRVIFFQLKKF